MNNDTTKLEKTIKEQAKQIDSLKKAMSMMQQQLNLLTKKINRTYETGRKNASDINTVINTLRKSG